VLTIRDACWRQSAKSHICQLSANVNHPSPHVTLNCPRRMFHQFQTSGARALQSRRPEVTGDCRHTADSSLGSRQAERFMLRMTRIFCL
jgi:hypothetical protein